MATVGHKHLDEDGKAHARASDPTVHRALAVASPPMQGRDVANLQRATRDRLRVRGLGANEAPVPEHGRFTTATALACIEAQYVLGLASDTYLERNGDGHRVLTEGAQRIIRDPSSREFGHLDRARRRRRRLERGARYYERLAAKMGATGTGVAGALAFAAEHSGVREQPSGSHWGPEISTWIAACGYDGPVPWCGCFVNACLMAGGLASGAGWMGYPPAIVGHARADSGGWSWHGPAEGRPGDLALFDGPDRDLAVHVEIVRADLGASCYSTFGAATGGGGRILASTSIVARHDDRRMTGALRIIGFARPPGTDRPHYRRLHVQRYAARKPAMDDLTSDSLTEASAFPAAGAIVAERYRVRARLGRGASKEVYLAYDERLDREVALAIVVGAGGATAAAAARVTREAQITGRLGDHPNVITVYDTGEHDGLPYLVLRAMSGGSLADLLERGRPSFDEATRLGAEIAAALAHAHAHGVVHRDVKPDNVWLSSGGGAALGDFGIAHQLGLERLTAEGVVLGTVRYLSPEQIRGEEVGPASDLYALGVTLYELVAGCPPFTAKDPTSVLTQHLTAAPVPPSQHQPDVPPALERLILDLLAKDAAQRPPSAAKVGAALAGMATRAGGPAAAPLRRPDARRLVAVLAIRADVGDPEALHGVFDRCIAVIEQHGGTVERYLGDALVGFFGLDQSHGDDALRAARAAVELRAATAELRLGIESGEVFLGAGPRGTTIATGAAITAAGRLAENAAAGEILLGDQIRRAVATDATIDALSGRLLELELEQPALLRAPRTPFVGRARELDELHAAFAHARDDGVCRLVTVVGPPGIGKSRLAREFLAEVGDGATVLAGRCLAYGEGTTYRALADIVRGLGGEPRRRIEDLLAGDEQAIRGILSAIGSAREPAQAEETAWALRRLLERLARDRPLVVAVEDIHWAEPVLLDLLDHVVALSSWSPILLVCLTRPELLESRPGWAAPQPNRAVMVLDALAEGQARELAERLGAKQLAGRIAQRAEGNPLFVEQLVAVDAGRDERELPASIQAVLIARIDRLEAGERLLLQHAAVQGRSFHAGALAAALPEQERDRVGRRLVALARKGLLGADRAEFAGEDAFRFTHALIREAAYTGLPKLLRAELHAGVAAWLERHPAAADEIIGYHLEQACLLRNELGQTGATSRLLATRAADRLHAASRGALSRGDPSAANALLERAIALVDGDDTTRAALLPTLLPALGSSLFEAGLMADAARVLDQAIARAPEPRSLARAQIEREFVRLETETGAAIEQSRRVADAVLPVLEREDDDDGQCRAWSLRAQVAWIGGRMSHADAAWREAAVCARRAGHHERELFAVVRWRATAAVLGPTPVDQAVARCERFLELVAASPVATAWTFNALAVLHAMEGDFERAERFVDDANETLGQLGGLSSSVSHHEALVRLLAGQPQLAEVPLRAGVERLAPMGEGGLLATTTAMLAQAVYAQGRLREAADLCATTAAAAATDDIITQVIWRGVRAKVLARDGRCEAAEALAREAVALVEETDLLSHHGDAMLDLADVLRTCSRVDEASSMVRSGLALYEAKGNVVAARRARTLLD